MLHKAYKAGNGAGIKYGEILRRVKAEGKANHVYMRTRHGEGGVKGGVARSRKARGGVREREHVCAR